LGLASYFSSGVKETHAWTFKRGCKAPQCAGVIHTEFEKGFIRAEVVAYDDYVEYNGTSGARAAGALRPEGKAYEMQDGDVVEFLFSK
jgi:ribosome-binding ATPase YchF (GTP1/OBG family)